MIDLGRETDGNNEIFCLGVRFALGIPLSFFIDGFLFSAWTAFRIFPSSLWGCCQELWFLTSWCDLANTVLTAKNILPNHRRICMNGWHPYAPCIGHLPFEGSLQYTLVCNFRMSGRKRRVFCRWRALFVNDTQPVSHKG